MTAAPTLVVLGYADGFSVQPGETIRFMVSCEQDRYRASFLRPRSTGFGYISVRVYEQLQHGQLVPLKRSASRRVLRLSSPLVDVLRRHHARQLEQQLLAGQRWQEHHLVFPTGVGTPRRDSNLWLSWQRLLKRLGLPAYKFHELRHTAASLALAEGASLFHVSRMLG